MVVPTRRPVAGAPDLSYTSAYQDARDGRPTSRRERRASRGQPARSGQTRRRRQWPNRREPEPLASRSARPRGVPGLLTKASAMMASTLSGPTPATFVVKSPIRKPLRRPGVAKASAEVRDTAKSASDDKPFTQGIRAL